MKKIKIIFATLVIALLIPSCQDDGGDSKVDFTNGALPNITKIASTDSSINLIAVTNGETIHLGFTVGIGLDNGISSMDVILFYTKKNGDVYRGVLQSNLTTFPTNFNITQDDLFDVFEELNSSSDIAIGDKLTVSTVLNLKDGRIFKITNDDGTANYAPNIASSSLYSVIQTYDVSCPIDNASNFNGNYKVVADNDWADYAAGDIIPVVYNPADGLYTFRIMNTANPYLLNPTTSYFIVTIDPSDSTVAVTGNEKWDYNGSTQIYTMTGDGKVGSCTGDIDLNLYFDGSGPYVFTLAKE